MASADAEPESTMSGIDFYGLVAYGLYVCASDVSVNFAAQTVVDSFGMHVKPTDEEQTCVDDVLASQANAGPGGLASPNDGNRTFLSIIACMPATFTDLIVQDAMDLGGMDVTLNEKQRICARDVVTRLADIVDWRNATEGSRALASHRSCCFLMTESISSLTILTRSRMLDSVRMCCLIWSTMRRSKRVALSRGVVHSAAATRSATPRSGRIALGGGARRRRSAALPTCAQRPPRSRRRCKA